MSLYGGIQLPGKPDLSNVLKLDLLPMPALAEMTKTGMAIDRDWFSDLSSQLGSEIKELRSHICSYVPQDKLDEFTARAIQAEDEPELDVDDSDPDKEPPSPINVGSTQQLSKLLFDVLGIGAGHSLKMTKSGSQISTGKKQLEKFKREHPIVPLVLEYKEKSKIKNTYSDKLPLMAVLHKANSCWCGENHWYDSHRIHTQILTTRTSTGRLASKSPNLQNVPARTELGRRTRAGFIPSPGMDMFAVDFGQFEMRLGAHYSMDENLLRIFHQNLDPHSDTAMRAFKKTLDEVENGIGKMLYRAPCKNVNFGIFYGLTAEGLYDLMLLTYATAGLDIPDWLTLDWCELFIEQWFELYSGVRGYMDAQFYRAARYGIAWTLLGRIRRIPEVRSVHPRIVQGGQRQAGNSPIQGTQADLNKIAIAEVHDVVVKRARREGIACKMLITVHDEIVGECEQGYGELIVNMCEDVMSRVMVDRDTGVDMCAVPIKADGHVMSRWQK